MKDTKTIEMFPELVVVKRTAAEKREQAQEQVKSAVSERYDDDESD